jgi:two-component system LytT family response regulator
MKVRTLIADDELLARKLIKKLIGREPEFEVVAECADGRDTVSKLRKLSPDLVFLDVQMPECDGFQVIEQVGVARMPVTIFVTAYDDFALRAFEAHALDYLLKPFDEERFFQTLRRVKTFLCGRQNGAVQESLAGLMNLIGTQSPSRISRLAVKAGGRVVFLKTEEIDWIEALGNYLDLHTGRDHYLLRGRISELEKKLAPEQFFRIHRSTIVNLDRVKEFQPLFKGEGVVVMKDGSRLSASRSCSQRLQAFLAAQL